MRKLAAELLWFCILLSLILIMGYLLIGGDILLFLAPRMVPMVWFGLAVLIALYVWQALHIIRLIRNKQWKGFGGTGMLLFAVPVVLLLTVMPNATTSGTLPNQNVKMISLSAETATAVQTEEAAQVESNGESDSAPVKTYESVSVEELASLNSCILEDETAPFDPSADLFSKYQKDTLEDLVGKTITVYGFVYKEDAFPEDTVLVARMMVACCAADAWIVGFHVKVDNAAGLAVNDWIRVTGTVRSFNMLYYGETYDFPVLTDGIILRCEAPDAEDAYLYP
jgi:putative membrane protein